MIPSGSMHSLAGMFIVLCTVVTGAESGEVPPRSDGGQTLAVPKEQLDQGEVYYVSPGEDTQLVCVSDTPLQRVVLTCSRVVGYVVAPFDMEAGKPPLLAGALRIPVAALDPGLGEWAELLNGPSLLNAAEFPEVTFRITHVSDPKRVGEEGGRTSFTLNIAGELTARGKTLDLDVPARVTFMPFTWRTMGRNVGELLSIRAKFDLKPADLGLQKPDRSYTERVADVIHVDAFLLCNTMSPEKTLEPNVKKVDHLKQLRFLTLVRDFDDPEKGYEFGRTFMREIWDDAQALNRLAWATLTEAGVRTRDLAFALKAAQRANEVAAFKDPALLHTLARAYYERADLELALKWARQAVQNIDHTPEPLAAEIRAALERYEKQAARDRD